MSSTLKPFVATIRVTIWAKDETSANEVLEDDTLSEAIDGFIEDVHNLGHEAEFDGQLVVDRSKDEIEDSEDADVNNELADPSDDGGEIE